MKVFITALALALLSAPSLSYGVYEAPAKLTARFDILKNMELDTSNATQFPFLNKGTGQGMGGTIGMEAGRRKVELIRSIEAGTWDRGATALCFAAARSTMEINMCASMQSDYVEAKLLSLYQKVKEAIETNPHLKKENSDDMIRNKDLLRNAGIAFGKIAGDLCEAGTMDWWGGTGRSAALMGCHSKALQETEDMDMLLTIAKFDPSKVSTPTEDAFYDVSDANFVVNKYKEMVIQDAGEEPYDSGDGNGPLRFPERYLLEADQKLNEEYSKTRAWYNDENFPVEEWTYTYDIDGDGVDDSLAKIGRVLLGRGQNAWIKYRDAYCQAYSAFLFPKMVEHDLYGGLARVSCLRRLTEAQTKVLSSLRSF